MTQTVFDGAVYVSSTVTGTNIQLVACSANEQAVVNVDLCNQNSVVAQVWMYRGTTAGDDTVIEPGIYMGARQVINRTAMVIGNSQSIWVKSDTPGVNANAYGYTRNTA